MIKEYMKNTLKGFNAKLITEAIFRESNKYETCPFGYESVFSRLINALEKTDKSETSIQLRSMPDLLVFDSDDKKVFLVECKYRNAEQLSNVRLSKSSIDKYKKYWNGCIIVVIVPLGSLLYAQWVKNLNTDNRVTGDNVYFNVEKDFEPFTSIFPKIDQKIIDKYKTFIRTISNKKD